MSIESGSKLGPYEVLSLIGAGGMGEVYRANDTRLDRTVAIKVLPSHLSSNPDLRERLEREARAVSSLNHPHICTLHDIGSHEGTDFLVMEYIDGESLADRLKKGPLPLDQALRHGIEIADALDKAHRTGVVHRDLKPGNIMLTQPGAKLLDFGLAKFRAPGSDASTLSALPTEEKPLTEKGSILGTFQYMSPEQLEGKDADARTDIFAFGAVLYEMVTGKKAFEGKSQASLITAIMSSEPAATSSLQPTTPPLLDHVIRRCLAKHPDERWQTASDMMRELKWIAEGRREAGEPFPAQPSKRISNRLAVGIVGGLAIGALLVGLTFWSLQPSPSSPPLTRFGIVLADEESLSSTGRRTVALSPDGKHLAYSANGRLNLRSLDQMEVIPIRGTEEERSRSPFFSPDGQWVGFHAEGKLRKVPISGGAPLTLCDADNPYGVSWGSDNTIVFGQGPDGILRVSENGGTPEVLVPVDSSKGESAQGPQILPGGKALLFSLQNNGGWDEAQIMVQSLETGERHVLIEGGADARYVPTGHIVYALEETLLAVPFDLKRLEVTGGAVPVVEDVARSFADTGIAQFTVSDTGSLVFVPAGQLEGTALVWMDRQGAVEQLEASSRQYFFPSLSPNGELLVAEASDDLWIYSILRNTSTRLTFTGDNSRPIWTPDGKRVTFCSGRSGAENLFWKLADGSEEAEQLSTGVYPKHPDSWSPDGQVLAYHEHHPRTLGDIWILSLEGQQEPQPFIKTEFSETAAMFSPNGRWIAYVSNESGRDEIYVQPYPGPGGKYQISSDGGAGPVWARNGRELFYSNRYKMMVVEVTAEHHFIAGNPRMLFEQPGIIASFGQGANLDLTADGQRFLIVQTSSAGREQINVVLNWFEELKRLVPSNE